MCAGKLSSFQVENASYSNGEMHFCTKSYTQDCLKKMSFMKSNQTLTDVDLEVGPEIFHAHKIVLAAASPYFKAMFTGGLIETEMKVIKLQGVCPTVMSHLLNFIYSGEIRITEILAAQLLPAATMFQVTPLIEACCSFFEHQLDPSNAIGIANFALQHSCMDLHQTANQFIERNFIQVCKEEEFLQLSPCQLVELCRCDELNVSEERDVYNAVLKWVSHDPDTRTQRMQDILTAVRCQFLTPHFIQEQINNCELVNRDPACREYLSQIFRDLTLHRAPKEKQRTPSAPCILYTAGGYFRRSLDLFETFLPESSSWSQLTNLPTPRSGLGGAFLQGKFYIVGGRNNCPSGNQDSSSVECYDPSSKEWNVCTPMNLARNRVGVAVLDGFIYALGGSVDTTYHTTVERYDPEVGEWAFIAPMSKQRIGVGSAVINRLLYAVGGFDGNNRLTSVECYYPEKDEWNFVASLNVARSGAGVVTFNGCIYAVGGYDGIHQLKSVERYDPEQDKWTLVAPMKSPRSALAVAVLDNKLYSLGGYDGHEFLSTVEMYDAISNKWTDSVLLSCGRSGHCCAVSYSSSSSCIAQSSTTQDAEDGHYVTQKN